jgi:hypothetical protein
LWATSFGLALASIALLSSSVWASGSVIVSGEGPFDTPYQPAVITAISQVFPARDRALLWPGLNAYARSVPPAQAADVFESSYIASYDIFATGREFLPVGGFTGQVPEPSLRALIRDVAEGKIFHATAAVAPRSSNPDMIWIIEHCNKQTSRTSAYVDLGTTMQRFTCSRADGLEAEGGGRGGG